MLWNASFSACIRPNMRKQFPEFVCFMYLLLLWTNLRLCVKDDVSVMGKYFSFARGQSRYGVSNIGSRHSWNAASMFHALGASAFRLGQRDFIGQSCCQRIREVS